MPAPHDHAHVIASPPLITFGIIAIGIALHAALPASVLPRDISRGIGLALLIASVVPGMSALLYMLRARTTTLPRRAVSALVTSGPFRYSRNPIYLSFVLFHAGLAFLMDSLVMLALLPVLMLILTKYVIEREETYLTRQFGDEYARYCASVRRWL